MSQRLNCSEGKAFAQPRNVGLFQTPADSMPEFEGCQADTQITCINAAKISIPKKKNKPE
jgi:hypothetical protein